MVRKVSPSALSYASKVDADAEARWAKVANCGYAGCLSKALIGIHLKTGWLNVCWNHYHDYWHSGSFKEKPEASA